MRPPRLAAMAIMAIERQRGHAVAEATVVLGLVALIATAVDSIGRLQWHGLHAGHATRVIAFRHALGDLAPAGSMLRVERMGATASFEEPGGRAGASLRRQFGVADGGTLTAHARVPVALHRNHDRGYVLNRHTSILIGAGHARDDVHAQSRIGASRAAWGDAARLSVQAARRARSQLRNMDSGWRREPLDPDWLKRWTDLAPADRVRHDGRMGRGRRR
ncbi:hypothetical protein CAL14_13145 [Bordetella genomosp. 9]|nr:hypothetical protein CAL14_13145 [Bordetella genomosp. 9]